MGYGDVVVAADWLIMAFACVAPGIALSKWVVHRKMRRRRGFAMESRAVHERNPLIRDAPFATRNRP